MNFEYDVLIVGAGPTGLACAIECERAKLRYRLIDEHLEPAQWSQALVVQARTLEQFDRYGAAEKLLERGHPVNRVQVRIEGRALAPIHLSGIPGRFPFALFVPQRDTEECLIEVLTELGGAVQRGTYLTSCVDHSSHVVATLCGPNGTSESVAARWLIACDGAHSTIREALNIHFPGATVDMHFYLADCVVSGKDRPVDEIQICLGKGELAFLAPATALTTRIIYATRDVETPKEALSDEQMQTALDHASHNTLDVKITGSSWRSPFHVNEREIDQFRHGNIFFAGDAAHIHSPVFGQGMNTGIQDAANLVWKLAAMQAGADVYLVDSYDRERRPVAHRVITASSNMLHIGTTDNPLIEALREAGTHIVATIPALQCQVSRFISETNISYRHSPAVHDTDGKHGVSAGDRAPDAIFVCDGESRRLYDVWKTRNVILLECEHAHTSPNVTSQESLAIIRISATALEGEGAGLYVDGHTYVLRPDGYIGYRGNSHDETSLCSYLQSIGIAFYQPPRSRSEMYVRDR